MTRLNLTPCSGMTRTVLLTLSLCLLASTASRAADAPAPGDASATPDPLVCLEFESALALAASRDPRVLGSLANEADFDARITEARALFRPNLTAFGRTGAGEASVVDNSISNQIGLQFSQRVLDFGDAKYARRSARANFEASQFETRSTRLNAAAEAGGAYLEILRISEMIERTRDRRSYFVEQLDSLDRLLDTGAATRVERATVAAQVADADVFVLDLRLRKESAEVELEIATGRNQLPCSGAVNFGEPVGFDVSVALSINPEIRTLRRRADALAADLRRQELARLPVLSLVATGSYASIGGFSQFEYRDRVGIDVSVPLYTGNGLRAARLRAEAREQIARSEVLRVERLLREELETAQRRVVILQEQLQARLEAVRQQTILLDSAGLEQQAGTLTFRELVEIRLDYESATLAEIATRYDLAQQRLDLLVLNGTLTTASVSADGVVGDTEVVLPR